jgi:hypothetical protein
VRAALGADGFYPHHAMRDIAVFLDGVFTGGLGKAGPAAACVKLGFRFKQLMAAAHTCVAALLPMLLKFTRVRALGSSVAGNFKGCRFSATLR